MGGHRRKLEPEGWFGDGNEMLARTHSQARQARELQFPTPRAQSGELLLLVAQAKHITPLSSHPVARDGATSLGYSKTSGNSKFSALLPNTPDDKVQHPLLYS